MDILDIGGAGDQVRVDRRQAMKAALGGAAAAVALSVPRIEGFSIAPDYAAASSASDHDLDGDGDPESLQCARSAVVTGSAVLSKASVRCHRVRCWGGWTGSRTDCTCRPADVPGVITVPVASDAFTAPTITARASGPVYHDAGHLEVTLGNFGLNEPFSSCTVTVSGTCTDQHAFVSTVPSTPLTANGTIRGKIYCAANHTSRTRDRHPDERHGGHDSPDGRVTISVTCICGPD